MNPKPTNAAILTNQNSEILLVKRKVEPKKGYWDLPGGFIDLNESAEESMARELKEELDITLKDFSYLGSFHDIYLYQNTWYPTLGFIFTGKLDSQKIYPSDDISGIKFFSPNALPYSKIAFESIKQALKRFLKS